VRRRHIIMLIGGAAVWPLAARAQQPQKVWRVGYLGFGPASSWTSQVEALRSGLRDLGYVEGKNIVIEFRWAEHADQTPDLATQLARMNVDVIFAPASTQVQPARKATNTIPIVFAQHADPVGLGDVASLSRPGGNITGLSMLLTELSESRSGHLDLVGEGDHPWTVDLVTVTAAAILVAGFAGALVAHLVR